MFSDMAKGPRDQPTKCKASFPSLRSPAYVTLKMLHPGRHPAPWGKQSRRYEPSVGALAHSWGLYERWVKLQGLETEAEGSGRHPEGEAQVGLLGAWHLSPRRNLGQGTWERAAGCLETWVGSIPSSVSTPVTLQASHYSSVRLSLSCHKMRGLDQMMV